jgi:hypothetical protein
MSDELPFTVVRSHDHDNDEVLARAVNLLIARHAYREAARIYKVCTGHPRCPARG